MFECESFCFLFTQVNDCRVVDTQVSREDGGNDTVTQMILASGDLHNLDYIANVI